MLLLEAMNNNFPVSPGLTDFCSPEQIQGSASTTGGGEEGCHRPPGRPVGLFSSLCHPEGIREEQRRDCQTAGARRDFVGFVFPQHCLQR